MDIKNTHLLPIVLGMAFLTVLFGCDKKSTTDPVPSYQDSFNKFMDKRKTDTSGPKFSAKDKQVMEKAARQIAENLNDPGLKVGTKAPEINLSNAFGKKISLYQELKKGPVVLVFYRGAWCPFCNMQLHALNKSLPHFKKYGAQLIAVTPQKPDKSLGQVKKDGYPFEILSDLDSSTMKAYKLFFEVPKELVVLYKQKGLDLIDFNGEGRAVLPAPGTFIIDQKGIIRAMEADTNYMKRMEPAAIIAALEKLG